MRVTDRDDWFDLWLADKKAMIATMRQNMCDDINAGYNPNGECIKKQREEITQYEFLMNNELSSFVNMSDREVNRYCYYDMLKRGVIE